MSEVRVWDVAAANNIDPPPDGWPEGMEFNQVNNAAREVMAAIKRYHDTLGAITTTGTASAYALTVPPTIPALVTGDRFSFIANHESTGASTLAVNGLAVVTLTKVDGTAIAAADILAGGIYEVIFDGTDFQVIAGIIPTVSLAAGSVGATELATNAVTTTKINALAVTDPKIASNAVIEAKIAANAVTTPKVNNAAITRPKLGSRSRSVQTGTAYALVASDELGVVTMNNALANAVTINTNATTPLNTEHQTDIIQIGVGVTTIQAATGVTLNGVATGGVAIGARYGAASIYKIATNDWLVFGNIGTVA